MAVEGATGLFAVIGHRRRAGAWQVPSRYRVVAWMGGVSLDLSEAELPVGGADIELVAVAGVITVLVPRAIRVEVTGDAVTWVTEPARAGVPIASAGPRGVVRIHGRAFLGTVLLRLRDPQAEPVIAHRTTRPRAS